MKQAVAGANDEPIEGAVAGHAPLGGAPGTSPAARNGSRRAGATSASGEARRGRGDATGTTSTRRFTPTGGGGGSLRRRAAGVRRRFRRGSDSRCSPWRRRRRRPGGSLAGCAGYRRVRERAAPTSRQSPRRRRCGCPRAGPRGRPAPGRSAAVRCARRGRRARFARRWDQLPKTDQPVRAASISSARDPSRELPLVFSPGDQTAIEARPGATARMPPPTPLLPGNPTR